MQNKINSWSNTAFLYDFDNRQILKDDIEFYEGLIERTDGSILEIACGTGRLTIPLSQISSRKYTAFDFSESMLDVLRNKLKSYAIPNLSVFQANMINFQFDEKFGLVLGLGSSMLTCEADMRKYLLTVYDHMSENALYTVNVVNPGSDYGDSWLGKENITYDVYDEKSKCRIVRSTKNISSDKDNQTFTYLSNYEVTDSNKNIINYSDELTMRYYYKEQIDDLLISTGFDILEYRTTFSKDENESSKWHIYVCTK